MKQVMKLFCCKTMMDEIARIKPDDILVEYIEYALHRNPDKLRAELQKRIDREEEADVLVFVYGLCSRGLDGLKARNKTLVIPRVHDCISILLGSRDKYQEEFEASPGTYYLSKGWIDQKADPYQEYEEYVDKYGEENAKWVIEQSYKHYKRLVFIDTKLPELDEYKEYAQKVARFMDVDYIWMQGQGDFFEKLVSGSWEKDFIVVNPGETSRYQDFM
ncbi:MAG: DUF1638 domain-containing protein [Bacillota bacterium]|nr:DUF1638 domain-containing protein [Bacillota bacterium]